MNTILIIIVVLYIIPIAFIALYSFAQLHLLSVYLKNKKNVISAKPEIKEFPMVTVQLPIYNELYVIERLIDRVCEFDYPLDRLEIQVIDDSTDETLDIVAKRIATHQANGIDIKQVFRKDRVGYKAGALEKANITAKGEFLAIFDADFIPRRDFLIETIPFFVDSKIGVVQTRWDHLNLNYSILTKVQGFALDAHFSVEQTGRNVLDHFINFNGTAGVWRKTCIDDAGGWQPDTLTEDLDLSYRAQLKGWKFKYLAHIESPAELPVTMTAIKSQQFRWTKGAAEVSKKLILKVLKSNAPLSTKFHAFFHLLNSTVYISIFLVAFLSVPVLYIKNIYPETNAVFKYAGFFLVSLIILGAIYYVSLAESEKGSKWSKIGKFLYLFPSFLSFSMGLSLHNTIAVIEGYAGKKSAFIRTPKFNINDNKDAWKGNKYSLKKMSPLLIIEVALAIYFLFGLIKGVMFNDYGLFHFHFLLSFGYVSVVFYTIKHAKNA